MSKCTLFQRYNTNNYCIHFNLIINIISVLLSYIYALFHEVLYNEIGGELKFDTMNYIDNITIQNELSTAIIYIGYNSNNIQINHGLSIIHIKRT